MAFVALLSCLLRLHSPDGSELYMEKDNIVAARSVTHGIARHVAKGTKTVLYGTGGRTYAVLETPHQIGEQVRKCGIDERK